MKTIFYDARFIRTDFHDGISRYSTELAKALLKLTPVTFIVSDVQQRDIIDPKAPYIMAPAPGIREPFMARMMNKYSPDIVFSPLQTFGASGRKFKLILTQHDMIYYHFRTPPRNLSPLVRAGWFAYHLTYGPQRAALNSADVVATVSETTKHDFEKTKLTTRPIVVIPNAPQDLSKYVETIQNSDAPRNIIYMGSFMPYKNVETLVKGMQYLPGHTLHLLSRIKKDQLAALKKITPKNTTIIYHDGVSDEEYAQLLSETAVLVTASLYEGYGLPIAEALALGVPAVVSDIPIFHEVAAGGALYFDPKDPKAFAEHIKSLDTKEIRTQLIKDGQAHIKNFSWRASAKTLLDTINSLV